MKLRDKDTKKYLLTVFVATFVAYIIPAVVLYLGYFMGFMWRKRSIPTHSEWLYPLTFDAGKGLKEA